MKMKCLICPNKLGYFSTKFCAKHTKILSVKKLGGRERTRLIVRMRDKFTCQNCGYKRNARVLGALNRGVTDKLKKSKSLDVHHRGGLCGKKSKGSDSIKDIQKLITLCHHCHFAQHDFQPTLKRSFHYRKLDKSTIHSV